MSLVLYVHIVLAISVPDCEPLAIRSRHRNPLANITMTTTTESCVNPSLLSRGGQPEQLSQPLESQHTASRASPNHTIHNPAVGEAGPSMHWSDDRGMSMVMDANPPSSQFMGTNAHEEIARFLEQCRSPPIAPNPQPTTNNANHSIPLPQYDIPSWANSILAVRWTSPTLLSF
jgi:hypothetical protein